MTVVQAAESELLQHRQVTPQQINPGETPEGLSEDDWSDIQAQIAARQYHAYAHEEGGYVSANPAYGWKIRFAPDGTTSLFSSDPQGSSYRLGFKLSGIGYTKLKSLHHPQQIKAHAATVTYQWTDTLRERWVNSNNDLEQWFVLDKRPEGVSERQPLKIQISLNSDLDAKLIGNTLSFTTPSGSGISYDKLKVWDATGHELTANMQLVGQTLDLIVDEADATYPLTIDPSIQQSAYLKASNNDALIAVGSGQFGHSISIAGDAVVFGALVGDSKLDRNEMVD